MPPATTPIPRIVIAGTHSGVGKTTFSLGVMAALRRRGIVVQPFKVGPDYLDPTYHNRVAGRPSRNLDGWMTSPEFVRKSFVHACEGADVAVIEGVMGLFDGCNATSDAGSTAEVAKLLDAPVVLIIDARAMARSAGAVALGYSTFDPDLRVEAVVFNHIASDRHYDWVRTAADQACKPKLTAKLARTEHIELPSRHLGLVTADENVVPEELVARLADLVEENVDLDELLALAKDAAPVEAERWPDPVSPCVKIALAKDEAFHFYYADNLDLLRAAGAEIVEFSPMHDAALPDGIGGVYLGGGYPEVHARALSSNRSMLASVRAFAESGGAVYGECGGLMYLFERIATVDAGEFEMAGLLPGATRMLPKLRRLGYVEVETTSTGPFGPASTRFRGHEYHYSELLDDPASYDGVRTAYSVSKPGSEDSWPEGYARGNVLASYVHLHFGSNEAGAANFVEFCKGPQ